MGAGLVRIVIGIIHTLHIPFSKSPGKLPASRAALPLQTPSAENFLLTVYCMWRMHPPYGHLSRFSGERNGNLRIFRWGFADCTPRGAGRSCKSACLRIVSESKRPEC
jgi:hypothetical protein